MAIYGHMDYLTKSYEYARHPGEILPTGLKSFYVVADAQPLPHYDRAWKLACGGSINLSQDKKQGARLDLSGQALVHIREYSGFDCDGLLKLLAQSEKHKRTTRIDYCFNNTENALVAELWAWVDAGNYKGRLKPRAGRKTPGKERGETVYFGAEKSDFSVRAYDKGAEMGDLSLAWARVEAQMRGEYAQNAAADSLRGVSLATHTRAKINASCGDVPLAWWREALSGEVAEISKLHRKETKWLNRMNQLMEEIMKKVNESDEIAAYVENEWLPALAENIYRRKMARTAAMLGDSQDVPLPQIKGHIGDDWTITYTVE